MLYVCIYNIYIYIYIPFLEIPQKIGMLLIFQFSKLLNQNLLKVTTMCVICAKYSLILTKTVTTLFKCVIDNHCIYQVLTRRQLGISSACPAGIEPRTFQFLCNALSHQATLPSKACERNFMPYTGRLKGRYREVQKSIFINRE